MDYKISLSLSYMDMFLCTKGKVSLEMKLAAEMLSKNNCSYDTKLIIAENKMTLQIQEWQKP